MRKTVMTDQKLFFELIRVSIGTQKSLSRLPSEVEWEGLFELAVKQSLVGVCFSGLHNLGADSDDGFTKIGLSEDLFFNWMGMAAQINMRNDVVNEQCVDLQKRLEADGFRSCILKGQGVALLYGEDLCGFRQSGDIDVWIDAPKEKIINYAKGIARDVSATLLHVDLPIFDNTKVEAHFFPSDMNAPVFGRRLRTFYKNEKKQQMTNICSLPNGTTICSPTNPFNAVYILNHALSHFLFEGVGLRQMMDYYFVMQQPFSEDEKTTVIKTIKRFGMYSFARGVSYILTEVFGAKENFIPADERLGKRILKNVMEEGNFGKYDKKRKGKRMGSSWYRFWYHNVRMWKYFDMAPWIVATSPVMRVHEYLWRLRHGYFKMNNR